MSNYPDVESAPEVREDESRETHEVKCNRCRGTGLVYVYDQETDCIACEGYGTVIIER